MEPAYLEAGSSFKAAACADFELISVAGCAPGLRRRPAGDDEAHRWGNGVEEHSGNAFSLGHCKGQRQLAKEKREEMDVKMKKKGRKYVVKKVTRKLKDGSQKVQYAIFTKKDLTHHELLLVRFIVGPFFM